ncbi:MAG: response regulator [Treponema sp.]|nr:response regulator [Treponema sp.]
MYKILLTDDEQIVIDSLKFIIDKNFSEQMEVTTALSGTEALEKVSKEDIDIIFMDINMPGLTGLETVNLIKKIKPETVIIILSAFDRFQYAQEAMNLGAFKYITKPVNRNLVIQTIRSAIDFIDNRDGLQRADQELQKKLDQVSPMIESDFIYTLIFNNDNNFDLSPYLDYFNLSGYPWCFCCIEVPNVTSENQAKLYKIIRDFFKASQECLVSSFMMNRIAVLFPILSENPDQESINENIKATYTNLSCKIGAGVRAGISRITSDLLMLKNSYNEAVISLNKTPAEGGIVFAGRSTTTPEPSKNDISDYKKMLLARFKSGDTTGTQSFFELYSEKLEETEPDINRIKNAFFELIVTAKNILLEIDSDILNESSDNAFEILSTENNFAMLKSFTSNILMNYENFIVSLKSKTENPIIKKVCDYIVENLSKEITLEQAAENVNVSSFYLSKLFKEEKGTNFINFLNDKRLEKARDLLKNSSLSIKEITAETGYNDQNYFSRIFRAKYGSTPTEYRKNLI